MTVVVGYVRTDQGEAAMAAAIDMLREDERLVVVHKADEAHLEGFSAEQDAEALHERARGARGQSRGRDAVRR